MSKKAVVIGGGASGMLCSVFLAKNGFTTTLLEKNEKLGKKIFITGKGRCNFTNACDDEDFFDAVVSNKKFMYSSYYGFTNKDMIDFLENAGMKSKIERGNRVFPESDHAYDVTDALKRQMKKYGVKVFLRSEAERIDAEDGNVTGVHYKNLDSGKADYIKSDRVVVATGGLSYPSTGSTGDGYRFAKELGHKVTALRPSLVSFLTEEDHVASLAGLSLKNVELKLMNGKKKIYEGFGEMLFTHRGISGPLVLTASTRAAALLPANQLDAYIDLKPAVSAEEFEKRILKIFTSEPNKTVLNCLKGVYPSSIIPVILNEAGIIEDMKANSISKEMRKAIVDNTKALHLRVRDTGGYNEAVITQGGVSVKEIDPGTMESKLVHGLYFIGEVLDLDALTGGYNLQIAWSTAYACGNSLDEV